MSLADLPAEILISICSLLDVSDFVSLTSTNKTFHSLSYEPTFWRDHVRSEFRIPPQPLLEKDGKRWQWLYKSLKTRSTVYTWGNDNFGNLGRLDTESELQRAWPNPMSELSQVGTVADVQCGGWSTVLLSCQGQLWAAGVMNGERLFGQGRKGPGASLVPVSMPTDLESRWPPYASHRTIKQFSMGRKRLLAISDEDEVIEWNDNFTTFGEVLTIDALAAKEAHATDPKASQVVAGWQHSSAYFPSDGLYYWCSCGDRTPDQVDLAAVNRILDPGPRSDVKMVSGTKPVSDSDEGSHESYIGPVKKYLVMENHIIMLTEDGRLFSWEMAQREVNSTEIEPTELTSFYQEPTSSLIDIQGSFRTFGVFSSKGTVLLCSLDGISLPNTPRFPNIDASTQLPILPEPRTVPALQRSGVIQLAFGDYHYHALHMDGTVTSHGNDPKCCGALGFGSGQISFLRGIDWQPRGGGDMLVHPESDGKRSVWFEPEKFIFVSTMLDKFMNELRSNGPVKYMASRRLRNFRETYAEWFEQEGRDWGSGPDRPVPNLHEPSNDDNMTPYFALKIAAAGWSSAAVVLVDKEMAEKTRRKYLLPEYQSLVFHDSSNHSAGPPDETAPATTATWTEWIYNLWTRFQTMSLYGPTAGDTEPTNYYDEANRYVWSRQKFPILKVPGTEIEDVDFSPWKGDEPVWLRR